ncbi:winged helix-turn-helix domain-containing protein [Labedaea rhizosphaerae]|uniref:ArsR family transcriptional regulator n=1 Tax=Labedaea rhizosphaerae TaxID=598644 RepID=A0A4R6SMN7_LABRH|nr:helix-turn-helix domain-containing protein [Labedaea rhizosphaerae]TDQ04592.1 ArsR family transcriptional regulator [Labedaea rhizosphaerae]
MSEDRGHKQFDARSLRAIAHPLRVRIMELLWLDGAATSTGLARRLGESSGTVSWHLRHLAEHDFIEEDVERGTKRERWWRMKPRSMSVEPAEFLANPDLRGPLSVYLYEQVQTVSNRLTNFLSEDWDAEWYRAAAASDWRLRLTPDALKALNAEVTAIVDRYKAEHDPDEACVGEGSEIVVVQYQSFPHRAVRPGDEEQS